MIRFVPGYIDAFGIHDRRRGREAVVSMMREWGQGKIPLPNHLAVFGVQAKSGDASGLITRAGYKKFLTPQHRRRESSPRQFRFPVEVGLADFCGNGFSL